MARLIRANGTEEIVQPANGKGFTIEEIQKLVGGTVQAINIRGEATKPVMLVNEDGYPRGLPVNKVASEVLQGFERRAAKRQDRPMRRTTMIVGDVVLCVIKGGTWQ